MKTFRQHILPLSAILFFWVLYFSKIIIFQQVFFAGDNNAISITFNKYFIDSIKQGELALWNPHILSGVPILLPTNILIFPLTLLFLITSPQTALTINMIAIYLTAGIGMYLFSFAICKNKNAAFYSALIYMLSGFMAKNSSTYINILSIAYMPLFFWLIDISFRRKKAMFAAGAGLVIALDYFSGHPLYLYISLLGLFFYTIFAVKKGVYRKIAHLVVMVLFAVGFSSIMLLPQIEASKLSTRPVRDFAYQTSIFLPSRALITTVLPHIFGVNEIELKENKSTYIYLGILPLLFIMVALKSGAVKPRKFAVFIIMGIVGLLFSLGNNLPFYRIALTVFPGLGLFRQPLYFILLYIFSGSIIAGLGCNYFFNNFTQFKKSFTQLYKTRVRIILYVITTLTVLSYIILSQSYTSWQIIVSFTLPNLVAKIDHIRAIGFVSFESLVVFFIIVLISFELFHKIRSKYFALFIIVIITFIDLFYLNYPEFLTTDSKTYKALYSNNYLPDVLKNPNIKMASYVSPTLQNWKQFNRQKFLFSRIRESELTLSPNRSTMYGISSVFGFSPLSPKSYISYLNEKNKKLLVGANDSDISIDNPVLSQIGAYYITTNFALSSSLQSQFKLVVKLTNNTYLYQNKHARKRTYLVNSENNEIGEAIITGMSANTVNVSYSSLYPARLILLDNYYPGWEARVNGSNVPISVFNGIFREVSVPQGQGIVEFQYHPKSFAVGRKITLITMVLFISFLIWKRIM